MVQIIFAQVKQMIAGKLKELVDIEVHTCHLANDRCDLACLRMIYCMSNQFSELKMILHASSNLCSSSEHTVRDTRHGVFSSSSEDSSSASDFTSRAPASSPGNFSFLNPDVFQLIVQDLSHAGTTG